MRCPEEPSGFPRTFDLRATFLLFVVALGLAAGSAPALAQTTTTLVPSSYVTTSGGDGGQPVGTSIAVLDSSGTSNSWDKYVELNASGANYAGYRAYTLPASVSPGAITAIQVKVNYQGPGTGTQTWTWSIFNWATNAYVTIGTNAGLPDWGAWTIKTFTVGGTFASYVRASDRQLRVQVVSNNQADSADIDYEAIVVTSGGTPAPTATSTSAPTATSTARPRATATAMATATATSTSRPRPTATSTTRPTATSRPRPTATSTATATVPPTATPTSGGGSWWKPAVKSPWHWQLDDPVDFGNVHPVAMYDIDLFNAPSADVASLHARGIKVVCYFSAGSYESGRPDSGRFTAADKGLLMDGWPENWIDTRSANVRAIMRDRIQLCKDKGFDGVEPDNIDGYSNETGFPLTYATQLDYNRFLATEAHNRGLAILLKNDGDQAVDLWRDFDGELNEECFQYDECQVLNTYFVQNGKPVFHVEYGTALSTFCPTTSDQLHFNSIRKPGTTVDTTYDPCPYNW